MLGLFGATTPHGHAQLTALFRDRPAMAGNLSPTHPLVLWALKEFEGSSAGAPVFWDAADPPDGIDAEHTPPQRGARASVRVRPDYAAGPFRGQAKPFADLWADLIFEFHNLSNAREYAAVHSSVSAGEISASDWLGRLTQGEHQALLATAKFYRQRWLPWTETHPTAGKTRRWLQIFATHPDFGHWMTRYQRPNSYPYVPLGRYYETVLGPHRARHQLDRHTDPADLPAIHWTPGRLVTPP